MRYPAVPPFLALLAGTACGLAVSPPTDLLAAVLVLGFVCATAALAHESGWAFVVATLVTTAVCGCALAGIASERVRHPALREILTHAFGRAAVSDAVSDPIYLDLWLTADAAVDAEGARIEGDVRAIDVDGVAIPARGGVLLSAPVGPEPAGEDEWRKGRRVRLPALLRRPSRYLDPGVPDHELALLRRGVSMVGLVKSPRLVEVTQRGSAPDEAAATVRARSRLALDRYVGAFSARSAGIAKAIVVGDRSGLDEDVETRLQAAGTYHVLAISGGNIAILAGVVLALLRVLAVRSPAAESIVIAVLVAYAWMVGGGASVSRATLMAACMLAAHAIDHRSRPGNAIAVSGTWMLAAQPLALFDPGAWLTYGATAAIVGAAVWAGPWLAARRWWLRAPLALFIASLAAEAALFPIAAYVFSRVTAAGLLVNFAAIPCMTVVQVAAMLTVAVSLLSASVAQQAGLLTHIAATGLVESGRLVDLAPWLARRVPAPAPACLIGYYVAALVAIWSFAHAGRRRRNTTSRVACGVASVAMVVIGWAMVAAPVWPGTWPSNGVRVTFIDVGQGDAALVQTPGGFSMLVDAGGAGGGRFDIGGRVVAPVLWTQGVRRLDVLVVTHGDADHVAGAEAVVRDFMPREIWEGVPVTAHAPLVALRRLADRDRVPWRVLQRGDRVSIDGVSIRTLHPPLADWERQRVRNDDSVALEVRQGDVSIVLPGDIEAAAEQSVSAALEAVDLRLIEAPHHGSASSSTEVLLDAARPRAAVISAGRGNRYGHPHAVVLERLGARHVDVYRTDRDGAVVVGVAGGGLRVETFSGRRASYPAGPPARAR